MDNNECDWWRVMSDGWSLVLDSGKYLKVETNGDRYVVQSEEYLRVLTSAEC